MGGLLNGCGLLPQNARAAVRSISGHGFWVMIRIIEPLTNAYPLPTPVTFAERRVACYADQPFGGTGNIPPRLRAQYRWRVFTRRQPDRAGSGGRHKAPGPRWP